MKAKSFLVFLILVCISFLNFVNSNISIAYASNEEQKAYCEIDKKDDFSEDTIIVVLTNKVSLSDKVYTPSNFPEISCVEVEDLNESLWQKIRTHKHSIECDPTMEIREENFNRILALKIGNPGKINVIDGIRKLEKRKDVKSASPDYAAVVAESEPNDYYFAQQWGLDKINIKEAWQIEKGSSNVLVGVIDSGIDVKHPDLTDRVDTKLSYDFSDEGGEPFLDTIDHGTPVAGIIGALTNNDEGVAGVCWNVTLVSLKITNVRVGQYMSNTIRAIEYAGINNIPILNLSYTFSGPGGLPDAIKHYPGLIVCSAGNDYTSIDTYPKYPASLDNPNIITVGASTPNDTKCDFSNEGERSVDIFAPGEGLHTTIKTIGSAVGYHTNAYGTSFAAPFVTGVAALLLSHNPTMSAAEIKNIILYTCDVVSALQDKCVSGGRLNAYKALSHEHDFKYYSPNGSVYHFLSCACGYSENVSHIYKNHTCVECGYYTTSHVYTSSYEWIDTKQHYSYCSCGQKIIGAHVIASSTLSTNALDNKCMLCGGRADFGGTVHPGAIGHNNLVTANGSFVLPNGVIVLVEQDYEAYFNGTLVFYPKGEHETYSQLLQPLAWYAR